MTCCELAELLMDFLDGELDAERRRQLEEHLGACPPCGVLLETYQITIRITRRLPCTELPEHLRCRCEEMLRQQGCQDV